MSFKELKKYILGFLIGFFLAYMFYKDEGFLKLIALGGGTLSSISLIFLILHFNLIRDYISNLRKKEYSKNEIFAFKIEFFIILFFIFSLYFYSYFSYEIPNTLNGQIINGYLYGIGLLISIPFIFFISKVKHPLLQFPHFRFIIVIGTFTLILLYTIKIGFFINYKYAESPPTNLEVTIFNKEHFSFSEYYLIVKIKSSHEKLSVSASSWYNYKIGDILNIKLHKGMLGYDVIDNIKLKENAANKVQNGNSR